MVQRLDLSVDERMRENIVSILQTLSLNHLFADAVVQGRVNGEVWCDRAEDPRWLHIIHPYCMSLLIGLTAQADDDIAEICAHLHERRGGFGTMWMQVVPQSLSDGLNAAFGLTQEAETVDEEAGQVQLFTRSNFRFDVENFGKIAANVVSAPDVQIRRMQRDDFLLPGLDVTPQHFWKSPEQFLEQGGGWCAVKDGKVASLAFTGFASPTQLEIGIETFEQYRGGGCAKLAAVAFLSDCIARGLEPVWSCRKQNWGSYYLAQRLGFVPGLEIPYYFLPSLPKVL